MPGARAQDSWPHLSRKFAVPNPHSLQTGTIPNNPIVAAVLTAIFKGGATARVVENGWTTDEAGRLMYRHVGRRGGEIQVFVDLGVPNGRHNGASPLEREIEFVESLNALTADVVLMALSRLCAPSVGNKSKFPLLTPVMVSAKDLIRSKNITRWGTQRAAFCRRITDEMQRIAKFRCNVLQYPGWDPNQRRWNHKGVSISGDSFLDIARFTAASDAIDRDKGAGDDVWLVRAGQWSQWWLNFQGKVWTSTMPHGVVLFDHRANRGIDVLAKKIGVNTHMLWGAFRNRNRIERRIDHLLEDIGELPNSWNRENHWAGRTRDRFDEALLRLQEQGIFGKVEWRDNFDPGDLDRRKGWVNAWLGSKITIYRPSNGSIKTDSTKRKSAAKQKRQGQPIATSDQSNSGRQIRRLRTQLVLTQRQLARKLSISASMLSQIENGRRSVPPRLQETLIELSAEADIRR